MKILKIIIEMFIVHCTQFHCKLNNDKLIFFMVSKTFELLHYCINSLTFHFEVMNNLRGISIV